MSATTLENSATPKYARLARELRQRISAGDLGPGDKLPSFSEFRAEHNVTLSTIEKALTTLESEGLIERFHGKGVFVREKPRATRCVGFFSRKRGTLAWGLYWMQFMEGLQFGVHAAGYDVLLINPANADLSPSWHDKLDGIIFHEMTPEDNARIQLPATRVNVLSAVPGMGCVVADEMDGAQQAVRHLLDLGHRRIAYLVDDSMWPTQMRLVGYQAALRAGGVAASPDWVRTFKDESHGELWTHWGKVEMNNWLTEGFRDLGCTALFCHNDEVAMGVMEALHDWGMSIPGDISLVGYDGTILCQTSRPELTSIKVPLREIGLRAANLLIEQIETGTTEAMTLSSPTTLELHDSTSRLANPTF